MKLKSLLFGSAAALMAVTGAQAAEPILEPIAEPVDYVRICDAFGTGFFYIPGTDTCLRIGGYVRAEFLYDHDWDGAVVSARADFGDPLVAFTSGGDPFIPVRPREDRNYHEYSTRARGRLTFDTRVQTDIGMIRTFTDLWITLGPLNNRNLDAFGDNVVTGGAMFLRQAFVQIANDWGTLTFGRADSFFEFWESDAWAPRFGDDAPLSPVNLAAATFNLGGGISATVALEDSATDTDRRRRDGGPFFPIDTNFDGIADAIAACAGDGYLTPPVPGPSSLGAFCPGGATLIHGGNRAPDVVANLRVDQPWGSAQVMGAMHHIRARAFSGPFDAPDVEPDSEFGWAVGAGLGIDIFAGLTFNIQGVYSDGAPGYATSGGAGFMPDGIVNLDNTSIDTTEAWSVKAGVGGNLAPDWIFNLQGSFARVDTPDVLGVSVRETDVFDSGTGFFDVGPVFTSDYDFWTVSGYVAWAPVRGFVTGLELQYEKMDFDTGGDLDRWGGTVRVQKSF
jgi:opacity protein-like surface antigen